MTTDGKKTIWEAIVDPALTSVGLTQPHNKNPEQDKTLNTAPVDFKKLIRGAVQKHRAVILALSDR